MLKKLSKRLSLSFTLLLFGSLLCSSGAAVIAETTTEPMTEENQLIKSPEESLPEAPPVLDVPETTNENTGTTETSEAPAEPQQTQEASEETETPVEVVEETQETIENTESDENPEKDALRMSPQNTGTGAFTVEGGELDNHYTYADHVLKFIKSGDFSVSGVTREDRIIIAAVNVKLTLNGVSIDVSANFNQASILIEANATATIDLIGENFLNSGDGCAGLQNNNQAENSLVIDSGAGGYQGYAGSLEAVGGNRGAGIGGRQFASGMVEILGGEITATGKLQASGIGGGSNSIGTITIEGGIITATGVADGAGIGGGGGRAQKSGTVTINGGTIAATGGSSGSDIGRGDLETGGEVFINGGNVKTKKGNTDSSIQPAPVNRAGKEVGYCDLIPVQSNGKVLVDGADHKVETSHESADNYYLYLTKDNHKITVESTTQQKNYLVFWDKQANKFILWNSDLVPDHFTDVAYSNNELILGGNNQTYSISMREGVTTTKKDRIKVTGKNVIVKLNSLKINVSENANQAALLIDSNASATINLAGENELNSGPLCAGLQNNNLTENSLIIDSAKGMIQGYAGSLTATGSFGGAGIGGAYERNGTVTIIGGSITAAGSAGGSGIGGGNNGIGRVSISSGKIKATGSGTGSGIGGGNGEIGTVTIAGGDIEAIGGNSGGSGIGGGSSGNGTVMINAGSITATGNAGGSGIGGGSGNTTGTVTIKGGKTTAVGGNMASGIGGGSMGAGVITIEGGSITATGGKNASGLGRGQYGTGGKVKIEGGSVKAMDNSGAPDSIDPRPENADSTELALCNLISFKENDQILVEGTDYKVNGPHKQDDKAYLYMTKEKHKIIVINNGQQQDYLVFWDKQANKFILWNSELMLDHFTGVSYANNEVILAGDDETYTISMREGLTTTKKDRIKVTGSNVTVRLNNVKIDLSSRWEQAALLISSGASATVDLVGENQLKSASQCAGLQNDNTSKSSLVINSEAGDYQGYAGRLEAQGGAAGAGIGGGNAKRSMVEIRGGLIIADGGYFGSGIGGGNRDTAGSGIGEVTITGGVITAKSGTYAAAIGGGFNSSGIVKISGGTITAAGNDYAPGIGDGDQNKDLEGEVTITGGSIKASAKKTPINPPPTNSAGDLVHLYQADASSHTDGSTVKVGTSDWNVSGKHTDDDNFYLYLPEEKHVVTVADNESFIEWKKDTFVPAATYTLSIPKTVALKKEGNIEQVKLTNNFHGVSGYNKQVTASLTSNGLIGQNLILKNSGDDQKQAHSLITYAALTLPTNSKEEETDLKLGKPIGTVGNDPLQAGTYKGSLIFEAELSDEEVTP